MCTFCCRPTPVLGDVQTYRIYPNGDTTSILREIKHREEVLHQDYPRHQLKINELLQELLLRMGCMKFSVGLAKTLALQGTTIHDS